MKALLSSYPIVADIDDAEIRNAIEGFASELEMAERAESAANIWYEETFYEFPVDIHFRAGQIAAFVSGAISMARDLGHLPEGCAA
ncbi:hypothetical protein RHYG_00003 [Rhizobium phage RR1-B]|uniref:hypothetical protein n=1 Tax=Rhizobium phage RR1-B TaxID=929834 RepID=UPI0003425C2E|nr:MULTISPECIES: hypothetical protein [Rhizobium/Agrobacterium group]YP_008129817.1 hypothetical protein RHYG_00003 [Rhizobium phage RR1-B]AGN38672.1 hypothetical protein RHYG_00003 [Rhizobium phage RR1-B]CAD7023026.1 hypothetical protein RP007_00064 [Rhizobium sp. P007]HAU78162.1 hypothetical protein [Agrobacterium sp.]